MGRNLDGAPGEIRTPDTLVRSQVLYPTELRAHRPKDILTEEAMGSMENPIIQYINAPLSVSNLHSMTKLVQPKRLCVVTVYPTR